MASKKAPLFKRVYVDLPPDTHRKLAVKSASEGIPMKRLLADMIEKECSTSSKTSTRRRKE